MKKRLANYEVVTLAAYLVGGSNCPVEAEEIAIKANEIAPGRFTWRKYPQQISLENIKKRLWDAKKPETGGYISGSDKQGWQVTEAGASFAERLLKEFGKPALARLPLGGQEQQRLRVERERLLASDAYAKFQAGNKASITRQEMQAFFRLDDYIVGEARARKILRISKAFSADPELGEAVKAFVAHVKKE